MKESVDNVSSGNVNAISRTSQNDKCRMPCLTKLLTAIMCNALEYCSNAIISISAYI